MQPDGYQVLFEPSSVWRELFFRADMIAMSCASLIGAAFLVLSRSHQGRFLGSFVLALSLLFVGVNSFFTWGIHREFGEALKTRNYRVWEGRVQGYESGGGSGAQRVDHVMLEGQLIEVYFPANALTSQYGANLVGRCVIVFRKPGRRVQSVIWFAVRREGCQPVSDVRPARAPAV